MRRQLFRAATATASTQDICIFCAARLQLGPTVSQRLSSQRRFLQRSASTNRPSAAGTAQQREEDDGGVDYQTRGNARGVRGAAVAPGTLSGIDVSPGTAPAYTGPTRGPAAPSAPPAFNDGWATDGWARTEFSSELTPEEQRQRDALRAASAAQTARGTATRTAKKILSAGVSGSGPWSCWKCGSSNAREASTCQNCRAVPLRAGIAPNRSLIREGGLDGSASQVRRLDQDPARRSRRINMTTQESVPQASHALSSESPPLVRYATVADKDKQRSLDDNDNLRQMRLRREETAKVGRSIGLSPRVRIAVENHLSIFRNGAIRTQQSSSPLVKREEPPPAPNVTNTESSGANTLKPPTLPERSTMTTPIPALESAESVPPEPEAKGWTRWSPLQSVPSPSIDKERSPAGANAPNPPTSPESPTMTAPTPVPESAQVVPLELKSVPLEPGSQGWTRWSPPQSNGQRSQPIPSDEPSQPVQSDMQSSQSEPPSVVETAGSSRRYAGRDEEHVDVSYFKAHRRAEKFDIDSPSQSVEYESNRPRARDRSRRSRQVVQDYDEEEDFVATRAERKRQKKKDKAVQRAAAPPTPIILPEFISIANLAGALRVRAEDFTHKMTELGFEETTNDHVLDAETAGLIASEFNFEPIVDRSESEDLHATPSTEDKSSLPPRPPVVTIMGHVDHGKTTLLDWLRKSSVAASEYGGITQHIGAFSVSMPSGRIITFLDTPGHAAFLSMRQRGANVTDIVILVVAADDSVKPQTIEAINHAKAARVPIIVAVNKIDKEDANVERVKLDLGRHGVDVEDFGGDTQVVCVSGKTGQGMDELEDAAIALADILDMRVETDGPAEGWVLEATTKKAGRVATVLVRRGTMRPGDVIVAGTAWARVRSLRNEAGVQIPSAGPGTPVEVDGWREQPAAGDEVLQAPDEQKAKTVVELRRQRAQRVQMATDMAAINEARRLEQEKRERENQPATIGENGEEMPVAPEPAPVGVKEVFFIIKADVSGSVEAVLNSISALGNSEIRAHVLRSGVGPVTEFDIEHAAVAKGQVVAFNTVVDANISRLAEAQGVEVLESNIIYRLIDDVKGRLEAQLTPTTIQTVLGEAEVAQVFDINVKGRISVPVAGCRVRNGVVSRNAKVRVLREKEVVFHGSLSSLKNVKKDVTEMRKGSECGISFENWTDFKIGDQVQCYEERTEKRTL